MKGEKMVNQSSLTPSIFTPSNVIEYFFLEFANPLSSLKYGEQ